MQWVLPLGCNHNSNRRRLRLPANPHSLCTSTQAAAGQTS
jgi:hypothetical protein